MALNTLDHYVLPVRDIKLVLLENPKNEFGDAEVIEQNFERFVAEHPGGFIVLDSRGLIIMSN